MSQLEPAKLGLSHFRTYKEGVLYRSFSWLCDMYRGYNTVIIWLQTSSKHVILAGNGCMGGGEECGDGEGECGDEEGWVVQGGRGVWGQCKMGKGKGKGCMGW